jgi:coenzyme F420 hydrogenase subunit beta
VLANGDKREMTYAQSWGAVLNRHLQFRCKVCPDGTGEFADIVFADAWYGEEGYPDFEEREGRSLILVRTEEGEQALKAAQDGGYIDTEPLSPQEISKMQPYQETRKRMALARLLAVVLKKGLLPRFAGLRLVRCASEGRFLEQIKNFRGTLRRA